MTAPTCETGTKILRIQISGENIPEDITGRWLISLLKATDQYAIGRWEPELLEEENKVIASLRSKNQALKTGNAQLREQNKSLADAYKESLLSMDELTADYDAVLPQKWEWMQRAQGAEARVGEQRETMDGLERGIEDWQDRADIITAELAQAQSMLKRTKRTVSDGTAKNRVLQSRLADSGGRLLAEKRIVKARDATIREMSEERDHAWITAENQIDALKRRIKVLEAQAVSAEDRHVKELSQLQALMDSRVTDREKTARRLVSAALILLLCLTAAFAAFVGA